MPSYLFSGKDPCLILNLQTSIGKEVYSYEMYQQTTCSTMYVHNRPSFSIFLFSLSLMERPLLAIFCLLKFIIHRATVMDGEEST